jgi:hypothetical protein
VVVWKFHLVAEDGSVGAVREAGVHPFLHAPPAIFGAAGEPGGGGLTAPARPCVPFTGGAANYIIERQGE